MPVFECLPSLSRPDGTDTFLVTQRRSAGLFSFGPYGTQNLSAPTQMSGVTPRSYMTGEVLDHAQN